MKAFEFRLGRVADYRQQQAEIARTQLQAMLADLTRLDEQIALLEARRSEARTALSNQPQLTGADLLALSQYQEHIARQIARLAHTRREVAASVEKQRTKTLEAERAVKLLGRMREKQLDSWKAECDRELDALAADSYLARLSAGLR